MLWMKKVNKKIYSWYLMLEILRSLFWNHFVKKCWSVVNLICKSFLQLTLGLQGSFLVRWWQLHCVDPQCTWWVSPSKPFVEIVIIILLNGKSSLFLFGTTSYIYKPEILLKSPSMLYDQQICRIKLNSELFCFSLNFGKTCTVVFYQLQHHSIIKGYFDCQYLMLNFV